MLSKEFRENYRRFPREELEKYRGQWVAFSADGRRIVASGETLAVLHQRLEAAGENCQQLAFEGIPGPDEDIFLGSESVKNSVSGHGSVRGGGQLEISLRQLHECQ